MTRRLTKGARRHLLALVSRAEFPMGVMHAGLDPSERITARTPGPRGYYGHVMHGRGWVFEFGAGRTVFGGGYVDGRVFHLTATLKCFSFGVSTEDHHAYYVAHGMADGFRWVARHTPEPGAYRVTLDRVRPFIDAACVAYRASPWSRRHG